MQSRLEEVLAEKERELKLYQRFLDLKNLCEEEIFPALDLPLKLHVESLKSLIERIVPDPRDRKEEMFSGEIFALLGTIYLHDIGLVKDWKSCDDELFDAVDGAQKKLLITNHIGERLDIPDRAVKIINYLSFSDVMKKFPLEWEITEGGRKALIRNTKVIQNIFNFSHLLHDVFYSDLLHRGLRRYPYPRTALGRGSANVDILSREGVLRITCDARSPYDLHQLAIIRAYVDNAFSLFRNSVNGRLGFQYKEIEWNVTDHFEHADRQPQGLRFSPYREGELPSIDRWPEASAVLDRLFDIGSAMVLGEASVGKTTVLRSFVTPQLLSLTPNVFYCELWTDPVREIREAICRRHENFGYSGLDIASICRRLLEMGPCFFLLDSCERLTGLDQREREKIERFLEFCFVTDHVYLVASGDKENFLEWFGPFRRMSMSAIFEVKPVQEERLSRAYGGDQFRGVKAGYMPLECQVLGASISIEEVIDAAAGEASDPSELRAIVAGLTDMDHNNLSRMTIEEIAFETALPPAGIRANLDILGRWDLVKEEGSSGCSYFSLSGRQLREPLYRVLKLGEFEEKRGLRNKLRDSIMSGLTLDEAVFETLDRWKDRMLFSGEEMGVILCSLIATDRTHEPSLYEATGRVGSIDIQPILKLVDSGDPMIKRRAIALLLEIGGKAGINPLIARLRGEESQDIREMLIEGLLRTGRKKSILAVVQALKERGDRDLRLKAIRFLHSLQGPDTAGILGTIRDMEEDPEAAAEIERLLIRPGS